MKNTVRRLTWFGHNCFLFESDNIRIMVDPFFPPNSSPVSAESIRTDYVLVSHGHDDHCADAYTIARNNNALIIAVAEIADFFAEKGVKTEALNIGGAVYLPRSLDSVIQKAQILAVQAPHSSTLSRGIAGGNSLGFVISFSQNETELSPQKGAIKPMRKTLADSAAFSIYFACDTGYFSEMNWIGKLGIDIAVLPIGDKYTMGPSVSLDAIEAISPRYVVPCHYNTWKPISQDVFKWSEAVRQYTKSEPIVLAAGASVSEKDDGSWS